MKKKMDEYIQTSANIVQDLLSSLSLIWFWLRSIVPAAFSTNKTKQLMMDEAEPFNQELLPPSFLLTLWDDLQFRSFKQRTMFLRKRLRWNLCPWFNREKKGGQPVSEVEFCLHIVSLSYLCAFLHPFIEKTNFNKRLFHQICIPQSQAIVNHFAKHRNTTWTCISLWKHEEIKQIIWPPYKKYSRSLKKL